MWLRLADKLAPELLDAPKMNWHEVNTRILFYLDNTVSPYPWGNHLALAGLVLTARRRDVQTVEKILGVIHPRLRALFAALGLTSMNEWNPNHHIPIYLKGEVLPDHSQKQRHDFWARYNSASQHVTRWLKTLPEAEQATYRTWTLPEVSMAQVWGLTKASQVRREQQDLRKAETDAIVPQFASIREQAHLRYNRMLHLRQAVSKAMQMVKEGAALPLAISYEEGGNLQEGLPLQERLHFQIWDRRTFVQAHAAHYHPATVRLAQEGTGAYGTAHNHLFVEFLRAERLTGDSPAMGLWFSDVLSHGLLGAGRNAKASEMKTQQWLEAWGYGREGTTVSAHPFVTRVPGLLCWQAGMSHFMTQAQSRAAGLLLPVESLYAASALGLLAVDLFTTTGMRINEAMQIRLTDDCFVRLTLPAPPESTDPTPRVRWVFRLVPKGERQNLPQDYFIGEETKRLLVKVARLLAEHYGLKAGDPLPRVAFDPHSGRAHRFGRAPYLFQYSGQHLSATAITACMRFLLHGMAFRTKAGEPVVMKAHLLRHAMATHAVQVEKIPVDIVGAWLKQKHLAVTDYYSKPTATMVGAAADAFLSRVAAHIQTEEAVRRSPAELQRLIQEASGRAGTLARVIGGHCVSHGFCAAKFACVGCAGKVPDPAFRDQLERHKGWAQIQVDFSLKEGLLPEAERMKQLVRDCETELQEMSQIEAYRRDEEQEVRIRTESRR